MDRVILLIFILNQGGPTTVDFASLEQCRAAEPTIAQTYREMTGNNVLTRCIRLNLPALNPPAK